jgi:hypothetical protein
VDANVRLYETNHRFFARDGSVFRTNRLWRRVVTHGGEAAREELIAENVCEVLYDVPHELLDEDVAAGSG